MRQLVDIHYDSIWRLLLRLGVRRDAVEDVAQEVLVVAARRIDDIAPGKERAFLLATAVRAAAGARRKQLRKPEEPDLERLHATLDPRPGPEELLDQRRRRELLDKILDELPHDHREVLVLAEHEGMTTAEIANVLGIPAGTVASRLSRARESFSRRVQTLAETHPLTRRRET